MNTDAATAHVVPSRGSFAWKLTLVLIPIVTLGILLWLRQIEVNALKQRTVSSVRQCTSFSVDQSKRTAIWLRAVVWENLDSRFRLHHLSWALPNDQQSDERTAKAIGKDRCASGLV